MSGEFGKVVSNLPLDMMQHWGQHEQQCMCFSDLQGSWLWLEVAFVFICLKHIDSKGLSHSIGYCRGYGYNSVTIIT